MTRAEQEWSLDWRHKGFPPSAAGTPSSRIGAAGWRLLTDFTTPVAALKESALEHNLDVMRRYCSRNGVELAPHGKTTMSPDLIRRQLVHGAWGMTAATAWQARAMLEFGARRVLIANECLDPVGLRWLAERVRDDPGAEVLAFADSVAAVESMRAVLHGIPSAPPVPVLVEVGVDGGRAGARGVSAAVDVGRAVAAAPELSLAGVAGFEGVIGSSREPQVIDAVQGFLHGIRQTAERLMVAGAFREDHPVVLSAGGSAYFDQVVEVFTAERSRYRREVEVVLRSGCYLTHDHGVYQEASPLRTGGETDLRPAMEVWSRVLSTPEPGLAIIDAGKRDISTDGRMPTVLGRRRDGRYQEWVAEGETGSAGHGVVVDHFNDQHGFVHVKDGADDVLRVGDVVRLGISHPCTTFDKWRVIPVVDDDYLVIGAVRTIF
ncbi:amino acid deaminase [Phytoactinopolyspora alkaliphila]|uniref:Amino acid deaminase n=1 Tax=Phytoactinopolyspora alkaliphila TaxID=1783498 RepID=A0A6N9YJ57_9ACTN|nr:alanine racemase [Phytoactinopolyspora alkaliphila]NED94987.1 amino acid deaminase [Phytoactinopolyspora alkaliphila]